MTSRITTSMAQSALAAKQLAESNRTRRNLVMLASILIVVLTLIIYLLLVKPNVADTGGFILAIAVGATAGGFIIFKLSEKITPLLSSCPSCGHSWEIKEGRSVPYAERMPYWDKCPGCGIPMRTELLRRIAREGNHEA